MESTLPEPAARHPADAVEQHYERLTTLLARHAGSADAARELLHDTWLRLARTPPAPAANASAYAYATARHLLIDQHRHRQTAQAVEAAAAREAAQPIDTTLHAAAHRQALAAIETALSALPERTRAIFVQHRLLDVPHADLARLHGVSHATVEREITRGAVAMHAALERWHGTPSHTLLRSARRRGIGTLLGLAGLLAGGASWRLWQLQVPQWQMAWRAPRGQQLTHALPDGSRVMLDAMTTLSAAYYSGRRQLTLTRGAAFFDVARDADRPFSVDCGAVCVTVLGTRFSVDRQADRVRIDVESGLVRVSRADGAPGEPLRVDLRAGEALLVEPPGASAGPQTRRTSAATAPWREGRLSFDGAPLADIVERLSRYHPRAIAVDPRVAAWPVTAEIRIALADEWIRHVLPRALPVSVLDASNGVRIEPRR